MPSHRLSLPLLTIRLDSLVSKFMGETAGKLRVVFEAAEKQRGVCLFDEFDASAATERVTTLAKRDGSSTHFWCSWTTAAATA
jgi:SpoVK/Ycf46/Vps4 family AAA+-type ATPase